MRSCTGGLTARASASSIRATWWHQAPKQTMGRQNAGVMAAAVGGPGGGVIGCGACVTDADIASPADLPSSIRRGRNISAHFLYGSLAPFRVPVHPAPA